MVVGLCVGIVSANNESNSTRVKAITAGWDYTVALTEEGMVVAWGDNSYGQCNVPKTLAG
jgi:alpha-tubulin suppressor-like RCC1 family protein